MEIIIFLLVAFAFVVLFRLLGAWMLRINEVINKLQTIIEILKKNENNI